MTASELQDLLVTALTKQAGGNRRRWRIVTGPVRVYDRATHPLCNWSVSPSGGGQEIEVVETLLDDIRLSHPMIEADQSA